MYGNIYDALHRFQAGRGAETVTLEANLLYQIMAMMEAVLFKAFLELQKAYDALDRYIASIFLQHTGSAPGRSNYMGHTGTG